MGENKEKEIMNEEKEICCIKRDGSRVEFDSSKITKAITKANNCVKEKKNKLKNSDISDIVTKIVKKIEQLNRDVNVEEIQDIVCKTLQTSKFKEVAQLYIDYRNTRSLIRQKNTPIIQNFESKIMAKNIENQNANLDEHSFSGRKGEAEGIIAKQYALDYLMSPLSRQRHLNNQIYIHDLDSYAVGMHNCLSCPIDDLLEKGFKTKHTDVRPAKSIGTALQLVAVIFQLQSLQQFGGVSATHLDWSMVPYVRKTFMKKYIMNYIQDQKEFLDLNILEMAQDELDNWIDENKEKYLEKLQLKEKDFIFNNEKLDKKYKQKALIETKIETYQAVEGMYHNLNTLQSRSGGQLPFSSINYGTCTLPEGRLVIKALLECSIKGIGKTHRTPIFPCGIFQCMKGVNRKEKDPNYDLFKLALKSTSLRLYPNYCNVDWSVNKGYDKKDPKTYVSTMGCVDGKSVIDYKIDNIRYVESFERVWNRLSEENEVKIQPNGEDLYIDTNNVKIYDCKEKKYVKQYRIIRNTQENWCKVKLSGGRRVNVTNDHPFEVENKGVVFAKDLCVGDKIIKDVALDNIKSNGKFDLISWLYGVMVCDGGYCDQVNISLGLDEKDILDKCVEALQKEGQEVYVKEWHRGKKGNYYELRVKNCREYRHKLIDYFGGIKKIDRHIPQEIFNSDIDKKYSFMAGIIDADGYINNKGNTISVQVGSTNKELALQELLLAKEIGLNACLYENHYKKDSDNIRYLIEFSATKELKNYIVSNKKREHFKDDHKFLKGVLKNDNICEVQEVKGYIEEKYSYDVTTESEHFMFDGIYSHNCRTYNGLDINAEAGTNPQSKDGRGNIAPVTIIMPTLAMEVKEELQEKGEYTKEELCNYFLGMLSKRIEEARDMLIERYKYICSQSPLSAKFMYENNTMMGYDGKTIESAMKHGTLVIGQLGMAETLQILIGCDHTEKEGMEIAKRIEKLFNEKCKEYKNAYKLNFGVYFTPAENLAYTALKKFRDKYGVIPNVSDRDYFTNSMHIPVWHNLTPFEKIDLEAELTGYSNAGCITYIELDSTVSYNLDTLEKLVNYAMDKDIPYFAINIPNDHCEDCGYTGEFNEECPICKSKNIRQLRRVTGYLTGDYKTSFNFGKQKETEQRHKHVGEIKIKCDC